MTIGGSALCAGGGGVLGVLGGSAGGAGLTAAGAEGAKEACAVAGALLKKVTAINSTSPRPSTNPNLASLGMSGSPTGDEVKFANPL